MSMLKGIDTNMIANNLTPQLIHPGELLKEELQAREISQKQFAQLINMPYTALNEILNGKRSMSVDFALLVEAALGIDADILINMQTRYNTLTARRDSSLAKRMETIRGLAASLL